MIAATNFNGKKRNDVPDVEKTTDAQVASNIASIIAKVAEGKEEPKRRRRSQERKFKFSSEEEEKATQAAVASNIASIMAKVASKVKNGDSIAQETGIPEAKTPTVTRMDLEAESEIPAKPSGDKDRRPPSVMILEGAPEVVILDDDDEILQHPQVLEPDVEEYHRDFEILDRDTVADTTRVPVIKDKDRLPPGLKGDTVAKVGRPSHIVDIMKKATEILVSHLHDESTVVQEVSTLLTNLLGNRVETWKEKLVGAKPTPLPFTITRFFDDMDTVAEPEPPTVTRKRVSEPEPEEPPSKRGRVEPESQELEDLMVKIEEDIEVIGCLIKGDWDAETSCPACHKQFNSKSELGTHIRKTHNDRESLKNREIQMSQQENFPQSIISQPKKLKEACKVCGDQSYSSAFGVPACQACQKFFSRKTSIGQANYVCWTGLNKCPIDITIPRKCHYCRYMKCLEVGMTRERKLQNIPSASKTVSFSAHAGTVLQLLKEMNKNETATVSRAPHATTVTQGATVTQENPNMSHLDYMKSLEPLVPKSVLATVTQPTTARNLFHSSVVTITAPDTKRSSEGSMEPLRKISEISVHKSEQKLKEACKVCGDRSFSAAYGVPACHACQAAEVSEHRVFNIYVFTKKFFSRKTSTGQVKYICWTGQKKCPIDTTIPKKCHYCRYVKCLEVGMTREPHEGTVLQLLKMNTPVKLFKKDDMTTVPNQATVLNETTVPYSAGTETATVSHAPRTPHTATVTQQTTVTQENPNVCYEDYMKLLEPRVPKSVPATVTQPTIARNLFHSSVFTITGAPATKRNSEGFVEPLAKISEISEPAEQETEQKQVTIPEQLQQIAHNFDTVITMIVANHEKFLEKTSAIDYSDNIRHFEMTKTTKNDRIDVWNAYAPVLQNEMGQSMVYAMGMPSFNQFNSNDQSILFKTYGFLIYFLRCIRDITPQGLFFPNGLFIDFKYLKLIYGDLADEMIRFAQEFQEMEMEETDLAVFIVASFYQNLIPEFQKITGFKACKKLMGVCALYKNILEYQMVKQGEEVLQRVLELKMKLSAIHVTHFQKSFIVDIKDHVRLPDFLNEYMWLDGFQTSTQNPVAQEE
ncbi:hypothetical protein CRE_06830 [Caenorhabditis remanei]|uniref:Nuclear receptor domain-containing protein n=1 Tax=Caenorhabditis remanei TaxID=31234 RepID=E3MZQ4_CAERE|nr:hypothetical protein CRE_06830 [Caenorhabditis remanei]